MQFDHVAQQVPDVAAAVRWWCDFVPQARILYQDSTWAFVEAAGTKLAFVSADQHPGHIAWKVDADTLDRLATAYQKRVIVHRDHTRSFYLQAPGGTYVELIHYPADALVPDRIASASEH